jgi:crotonobetainyl-CoA:carnitine CoA-transferase CaiB-like acyl-CoA transferase
MTRENIGPQLFPGPEKPSFPLNIVADFAGGGMTCALGVLVALLERNKSGFGQVVETDMVWNAAWLHSRSQTKFQTRYRDPDMSPLSPCYTIQPNRPQRTNPEGATFSTEGPHFILYTVVQIKTGG